MIHAIFFFLILTHRGTKHHILCEEETRAKSFKKLTEKRRDCETQSLTICCNHCSFLICTCDVSTDDCQVQLSAHQVEKSPYFPTDRAGQREQAQSRRAEMC